MWKVGKEYYSIKLAPIFLCHTNIAKIYKRIHLFNILNSFKEALS